MNVLYISAGMCKSEPRWFRVGWGILRTWFVKLGLGARELCLEMDHTVCRESKHIQVLQGQVGWGKDAA